MHASDDDVDKDDEFNKKKGNYLRDNNWN